MPTSADAASSDESAGTADVRPAAADRTPRRDVLGAQAIERDAHRTRLEPERLADNVKAEGRTVANAAHPELGLTANASHRTEKAADAILEDREHQSLRAGVLRRPRFASSE